jgi:DnaJ-class molecular chaperone
MNYYSILGLQQGCSPEEIKKAYRRLASQHHPDKGGDTATFQNIQAAYETLSDPNKRAQYDMGGTRARPNQGQAGFGDFEDFNDIFAQAFGGGFGGNRFNFNARPQARRNLDLNIRCKISLLDSYTGKELEANFALPSGRRENVVINVPPGITDGTTIQYRGMGDDSNTAWPRGNLNCTVIVDSDPNFERRGDDLTTIVEITAIEAMIGCTKLVESIDGRTMNIRIRPGIRHGGEYAAQAMGFKNLQTNVKGNFVIIVNITVPEITDPELKKKLEEIKDEIDKISK